MNSTEPLCSPEDTLCIVRQHQQAVIIVPTLLLFASLVILLPLVILTVLRRKRTPARNQTQYQTWNAPHAHHGPTHPRSKRRQQLQGIDAPHGLNPLEHEELPMTVQPRHQNVKPKPTNTVVLPTTTERRHPTFSHISTLPLSFSIKPNNSVSLHRAHMDHKDVVLRVLKDSASTSEQQAFLGFASFLSALGPHPFIPALVGVVSVEPPLVVAVEELRHRDLLGFLWRCRQVNADSECDLTEKRIFTIARQVASALEFLHRQDCIHGNVAARSVLIGADLTAKLWGFGSAYRRRMQPGSPGEVEVMELRKWQAPELLSRRIMGRNTDIWSFGVFVYEMVTLGDPPFAEVMATELLQYLQRGKRLKRPHNCSNTLWSVVQSCCHWSPVQRIPILELIQKLEAGEKSANGRTVLRVLEPINIEKYLREAGYGEAYNYAVL